ncbi:ABC transporter permease [soil metagenome]
MIWLRLAASNVFANRRRSIIALGSIALATIALILYAGYINQVREGLKLSFIHAQGTGHLQISGKGGFGDFAETPLQFGLTPAQRNAIETLADKTPEVRRLVPRLSFGGMVSSGPRTLAFGGSAIDPTLEKQAFGMGGAVKAGKALDRRQPADSVILGAEMARQLGVKPGDYVTVMTPTVFGALNAMDMTVVGVRETGNTQGDLFYLQAKLDTVQRLLTTDKISTLAILLDDDADVDAVEKRLLTAAPGIDARTWLQLQPIYTQIMGMYETQFRVFGTLILIVTLMGVAVLILTSVMERAKEIGVMRSLGIARGQVRSTFVYEGLTLCVFGLIAGTAVGALISFAINKMHLTVPPPPGSNRGYPLNLLWDWAAAGEIWLIVLVLGVIASWMTSGRIARMKVVQALGAL